MTNIDAAKLLLSVFPDADLIIITPSRDKEYQDEVEKLKAAGIKGVWRVKKET